MSTPTPASPTTRLRLHQHHPSTTASNVARNSIISSSAKGWSPLQINKRDSLNTSPMKSTLSPNPDGGSADTSPTKYAQAIADSLSPRRSSNSFKHVTKNSLVSNSPFKSPTTPQGAQAAGFSLEGSADKVVVHERRSTRALGETPPSAKGVNTTSKASIGLGITAVKPRSTSRTSSGSKSAITGQRRVSNERGKVAFPTVSTERRSSNGNANSSSGNGIERRVSGSKENESPDVKWGKRVPRSSMGLKGLAQGGLVSKSPFKRTPSGSGLSATTSTRQNEESPTAIGIGPSPKTIPVERDDVFSSPSPRRVSESKQGQRRASPSKALSTRTSHSPTPSPPSTRSHQLAVPTNPGSAGPSPLSKSLSLENVIAGTTPTPTPHKSSMTPSRRLRGPRGLSAGCESPTRKTVTFQSIPDVKEFEALSAEPSADGSFDVEVDDGEEWIDDRLEREDSLEELLSERLDETIRIGRTSPLTSEDNHSRSTTPVDSTTDAFLNTLVEEGLFSPPTMDTPAFEDEADFEIPLESFDADTDGDRPFLSTPSLGDSVHATPILASEVFSKTDSAGIPYGRTHHAERAALAHSLPPFNGISPIPIEQPSFPHNEDHQMLMNGIAAKPSLSTSSYKPSTYEYNDPWATTAPAPKATAHQSGPMPDPFITIQTATKTLLPSTREEKREEGGFPLGRTSHSERIQAARMLATQSLGLGMPGMPRSPAISKELTHATSYDDRSQVAEEEEDTTLEMELPAEAVAMTRVASDESTTPRRLPRPPAPAAAPMPMPLDIPSPVASSSKDKEQEKTAVQEKRSSKFELPTFSLPSIGFTSPFFNSNPEKLEQPATIENEIDDRDQPPATSAEDNSLSSIEVDRPLTPPPALRDLAEVEESPHRLPDFDFGKMTLEDGNENEQDQQNQKSNPVELAPPIMPSTSSSDLTASTISTSMTNPSNTKVHLRDEREINTAMMSQSISAHSLRSEFGPSSSVGSGSGSGKLQELSTSTKVRQRISREMIRETIQQRIADGSLNRKPATASEDLDLTPEEFAKPTMSKQSSFIAQKDKDLPPPPATELAPRMVKAHTTDATTARSGSGSGSGERPKLRPRSQTQSAHDVLKQIVQKDGLIDEPKSALDKLAMSMPMSQEDIGLPLGKRRDVSGSIAAELPPAPTSILRNSSNTHTINGQDLLPPPEMNVNGQVRKARSPSPTGGMREREQAIIARRKEKERQASGVSALSTGSRRSRRSLSTGDVGEEAQAAKTFRHSVMAMGNPRLTLGINDDEQSILDAFREETYNIGSDRGYKVRERHVVRASYQRNDKVGHSTKGGDIDNGKAWKSLRRPSDIHEHASEIRALKARENENGKASGTIFVKVLGIEHLQIPLPDQQTFFCVTLDNSIDYIRTPYSVLADGAKVNQEFSLVEHPNFEFSLSIDIRRDPHILKLLHEQANPTRPITPAPTSGSGVSHKSNGFRSLFASPRKPKTASRSSTPVPPAAATGGGSTDTIVKYLSSPSGSTIAKTHVAFKPIAKNCEARVLEIRYPMFAMFKGGAGATATAAADSASASGSGGRKQIAKITLQIFRLPPIPGLKPEDLPQCIDECLRGMRHHAWHEHEYHEGVLTQDGGDCTVPKRRLFKLIGGNLVAINEVTKKEVTKIDLRQAESVSDLNSNNDGGGTPKSRMTMRPRNSDEGLGVRPRSFALEFKDGDRIVFSADTDQLKEAWMTTLNGLIGKIPSNPLWAELLAARQRERQAKRTVSSSSLAKEARRHASGMSVGAGGGEKGRPVSMPMGGIRIR